MRPLEGPPHCRGRPPLRFLTQDTHAGSDIKGMMGAKSPRNEPRRQYCKVERPLASRITAVISERLVEYVRLDFVLDS